MTKIRKYHSVCDAHGSCYGAYRECVFLDCFRNSTCRGNDPELASTGNATTLKSEVLLL